MAQIYLDNRGETELLGASRHEFPGVLPGTVVLYALRYKSFSGSITALSFEEVTR